ncbi:hypothetical protein GGTG_00408 [Gaeumannomyces tritici R3-111a-1]|uniref:Uncharacterized protein n=1 Tax=Gaeumannomyces tritici (strain R3-111a-1) TaxID=644352 RepID=J3NGL9_GAET3|nr:hypothetical protein GGTG_00408 [Gaeumannomyces tritici R3-111a-1]EJT80409.1 hypothetical protein GGTG_00408 [Gaeumannomyces tritici R3-111a-1]
MIPVTKERRETTASTLESHIAAPGTSVRANMQGHDMQGSSLGRAAKDKGFVVDHDWLLHLCLTAFPSPVTPMPPRALILPYTRRTREVMGSYGGTAAFVTLWRRPPGCP